MHIFALFRANDLGKLRSAQCMGRRGIITYAPNQAGKRARSLFNCISVTDGIKINEQNKSIGIGPLYLHTEFEAISLLLQKVMAGLNLVGYRTLQYWQGASARFQKVFNHREMVWYEVLKIGC